MQTDVWPSAPRYIRLAAPESRSRVPDSAALFARWVENDGATSGSSGTVHDRSNGNGASSRLRRSPAAWRAASLALSGRSPTAGDWVPAAMDTRLSGTRSSVHLTDAPVPAARSSLRLTDARVHGTRSSPRLTDARVHGTRSSPRLTDARVHGTRSSVRF